MKFPRNLVYAVAGLISIGALRAQVPFQVAQAQSTSDLRKLQQQADGTVPTLSSGEEDDIGEQTLLGAATPRWQWVHVSLDSQYYYTSNAYLTNTAKKGTGLLVDTIDASIAAPPIALFQGQLYGRAGFENQWFNFGIGGPGEHFGRLDFDSATTYLDARDELPGDWTILGNVSYTRLMGLENGYNELYKELVPTLGLEKRFTLSDKVNLSVDYSGNYRFTDEPPFPGQSRGCSNRTDEALSLALNWQVAPKISLQPFYRFQYSYYPDFFEGHGRHDLLNTLGLSAVYAFNSWSSVRVFVSWEMLHSSSPEVPDYRKPRRRRRPLPGPLILNRPGDLFLSSRLLVRRLTADPLKQLVPTHPLRGLVRTGRDAARVRRVEQPFDIA